MLAGRITCALLSAAAMASSALGQTYTQYQTATLRTLDKITGRSTDIEIKVGEPVVFGSLTVDLKVCYQTPPEEPPESAAFLQVSTQQAVQASETLQGDAQSVAESEAAGNRIFSGWMFASSPGLSALEHPVYDVWVIHCTASAPVGGN